VSSPLPDSEAGMFANVPRWAWYILWLLIVAIVIILVALVVHALGGGLLDLRLGHFVFRIGVT
jgi:hypothetical protein